LERNDRNNLSDVETFNDVLVLLSRTESSSISAAASQELTALLPKLEKLRDFMDYVSNEAKPPIDLSIFWGLTGLVVQVRTYPPLPLIACS
jgi:hypothetical protein